MRGGTVFVSALLLFAELGWAEEKDPCSAASSVSDVQLTLSLKDGQSVFEQGEIIPLVLTFTATTEPLLGRCPQLRP